MANEIGYWNSGAGTSATVFPGCIANVAAGLYTAGAGQSITTVRGWRNSGGTSSQNLRIGLFATTAGQIPNGATPVASVSIPTTDGMGQFSASVSWALTNGVTYALAYCTEDVASTFSGSRDARTNGAQGSNNTSMLAAWDTDGLINFAYELAGNVTTASGPTLTDFDSDEQVFAGQTGAVITGTAFGASQGAGTVVISPTNNVSDVGAVAQTVTSWANTSIAVTVVKGSLSFDTNYYLFVKDNGGLSNSSGLVVQIRARPFIRETLIDKTGAAVINETGLTMLVWRTGTGPSSGAPNPDEAIGSVTTNGSGQTNQVIARGSLAINDPVWVAFVKNGTPARATLRKVSPVYA